MTDEPAFKQSTAENIMKMSTGILLVLGDAMDERQGDTTSAAEIAAAFKMAAMEVDKLIPEFSLVLSHLLKPRLDA